jgi:hypothetical protein
MPKTLFCNGNPKSGTNAILGIAKSFGCEPKIFLRALGSEEAYTRPKLDMGGESIFLSENAKQKWDQHRARHPIIRNETEVRHTLQAFDRQNASGHCHVSWARRKLLGDFDTVTVFRNPRDNYLSWRRWWKNKEPLSFFESYRSFLGWTSQPHITYDSIFDAENIKMIASLIGLEISTLEVEHAISYSRNKSTTWSGKVSNHTSEWTEDIDKIWNASGGLELDAAYQKIKNGTFSYRISAKDVKYSCKVMLRPTAKRIKRISSKIASA